LPLSILAVWLNVAAFPFCFVTFLVDGLDFAAVIDRMRAALWGVYIGDALAMPTHWYYDQGRIREAVGEIATFCFCDQMLLHCACVLSYHLLTTTWGSMEP
jgi:hypothetical protein